MIKEFIRAKVIIKRLKKMDVKKPAIRLADKIDNMLREECGEKRSEDVQLVIVPQVMRFCRIFCKRLLVDSKRRRL